MSLILNGTDGLSDVDGSASTPAIRGTDANTGIFFPAADTIAFAEGGAEVMRIDSSGQVGIGTASPANLLHVEKSYSGTIAKIKNNAGLTSSDAGLEIETNTTAAKTLILKNGGTETFSVQGNGILNFNSGYGSSATAYGCRAWVNFNGTGTPAIRASGNVSSITDNGTGDYTVNLTTAMPDGNYSAVSSGGTGSNNVRMSSCSPVTTTSTSQIRVLGITVGAGSLIDLEVVSVAIFR